MLSGRFLALGIFMPILCGCFLSLWASAGIDNMTQGRTSPCPTGSLKTTSYRIGAVNPSHHAHRLPLAGTSCSPCETSKGSLLHCQGETTQCMPVDSDEYPVLRQTEAAPEEIYKLTEDDINFLLNYKDQIFDAQQLFSEFTDMAGYSTAFGHPFQRHPATCSGTSAPLSAISLSQIPNLTYPLQ